MDMQNVSNLVIPEGEVRTIHDKNSRLLWGRVHYGTKYEGDTSQQSYSGKNLLDTSSYTTSGSGLTVTRNEDGSFTVDGTSTTNFWIRFTNNIAFDGNYTIATIGDKSPTNAYFNLYEGSDYTSIITYTNAGSNNHYRNFTTTKTSLSQGLNIEAGTYSNFVLRIIIVKGTYDLSNIGGYEPYVGGVPSPNPDYPQDINVATGIQTISITDGTNTQNFTVNLGATELCKIGNYRDYIYNSGDDWYVHKGISKTVLNGSEAWTEHSQIHNNIHGFRLDIGTVASDGAGVLADRFRAVSWSSYQTEGADGRTYGTITTLSTSGPYIYLSQPNASISNLSDFENWLSTHNTTVYYALATPTDTKITDATLVGQLNAVHQWLVRYGYNATVTGNLPMIIDRTNL